MSTKDLSPNNKIEIIMKTDMTDLRDIYFGKRQHVYFFGPNTKWESFWLVTSIIIFPFYLWYFQNIKQGGMLILGCIWFGIAIYAFWRAAKPIITWKKAIKTFLSIAKNVKTLKIIYDDDFILHIQDESEIKLNWITIQDATITDRSISLYSDSTNILLPKSSMKTEEYAILCDKVMERVQKVQKT